MYEAAIKELEEAVKARDALLAERQRRQDGKDSLLARIAVLNTLIADAAAPIAAARARVAAARTAALDAIQNLSS